MGYCDDCGNTLCICDRKTKDTSPYRAKIKELEAQLTGAESVIRFYADKENWSKFTEEYSEYETDSWATVLCAKDVIVINDLDDKEIGGKKAREYFEGKEVGK